MSKVAKAIAGEIIILVGVFTGNVGLIKFGYLLIYSNIADLITNALTPKPKSRRLAQDIEYFGTVEPRRIIYGTMRCAGMNVIPPWNSGDNNEMLHQILAIAGHEVNAITGVYFGQEFINGNFSPSIISAVTGAATDGKVLSGTYANKAWIRRYLGTSTQTADFILDTAFSEWTSAHRGFGVAYAALQYEFDDSVYSGGKPEVTFIVEGKKCYDPRLDVTPGASPTNSSYIAFTSNPALCLTDYLMSSTIGLGESASRIDWDSVVAAANICDENVAIPPSASPSNTQNRYTCNLIIEVASTDDQRRENIRTLAGAMMGHVVYRGGLWRLHAGAASASTFALTEDDLVGKLSIRTEIPSNDKYNYVRGQFVDAARNYQLSEFEPRSNSAYELTDGDSTTSPQTILRLPREVVFSACTNQYEAQRNAIIILKRSRRKKQISGQWGMSAFRIRPWDVGTVTCNEIGWDEQLVRCIAWSFNPEGTIEATFVEEEETDWDDPAIGDYTVPGTSTGPAPGGLVPGAPTNFTALPIIDGILFTWLPPSISTWASTYNIYEYTPGTASPDVASFANSTKIASKLTGTSRSIIKNDTTTRYYWMTTLDLFSQEESSPVPAGTGVASQALSVTAGFRATVEPNTLNAFVSGTSEATTGAAVVTAYNGTPTYAYSWVRTAGDSTITANSSGAATTTFTCTGLTSGETNSATFRCTVTDSASPQAVSTVDVYVVCTREDF